MFHFQLNVPLKFTGVHIVAVGLMKLHTLQNMGKKAKKNFPVNEDLFSSSLLADYKECLKKLCIDITSAQDEYYCCDQHSPPISDAI